MNCQLVAYIGDRPMAPLLLNALEYQEAYYGGHATGLGVLKEDYIDVVKAPGHVAHVKKTTDISKLVGTTGFGHSRYNSDAKDDARYNLTEMGHPFFSEDKNIALMHNGGIFNYKEHWARLKEKHTFRSYNPEVHAICDSEVAALMLGDYVKEGITIPDALKKMASQYTGSFLLAAMSPDQPEKIWIVNWYQPCFLAIGNNEVMFVSSKAGLNDVKAEMTQIFEPPKNSLIELSRGKVKISPMDPNRKVPEINLDKNELGNQFMNVLREKGRTDFREAFYAMNPNGWSKALGISTREWGALRRAGVSLVNPYIDAVEVLKHEGKIIESIDRRTEGGVDGCPRFSYVLV